MTEKDFQTQVVELATLLGWRVYHTHDSRRSAKGFPDLVLVRGETCLFWELKTETGRVTKEQAEWAAALKQVREVLAGVVRPSDWSWVERTLQNG